MPLLAVAVPVALLAVIVTGGSIARLTEHDWRWPGVLWLALAVQIAVGSGPVSPRGPASSPTSTVAYALLVGSYGLLVAFVLRNLTRRGMTVLLVGIALNGVVIAVDHGMPARAPNGRAVVATARHHAVQPDDKLVALGDVLVVPPLGTTFSVGDLLIVAGLTIVLVHAGRPRRRLTVRDRHLVRLHANAEQRLAALDLTVCGASYARTRSSAASTRGS